MMLATRMTRHTLALAGTPNGARIIAEVPVGWKAARVVVSLVDTGINALVALAVTELERAGAGRGGAYRVLNTTPQDPSWILAPGQRLYAVSESPVATVDISVAISDILYDLEG